MTRHLRQELTYPPLLVLIGLAVIMRLAVTVFFSSAIIYGWDSARFANGSLFTDIWMPSGYPLYLTGVHVLSDAIWLPIAGQHLLSLFAGVVVFLTMRRLDLSPAVGTIGAAILILPGDSLFLAQSVLTEALVLPLIVLACCATVCGIVPRLDYRWLVLAGVLAALAAVTRSATVVALPALALVVLLATPASWWRRLLPAAALGATGLIVVGAYAGIGGATGGGHPGLTEMGGWNLYARVAPFAYCSEFDPPNGTARLCAWTPPKTRPDSAFYGWNIPPPPAPGPSPEESRARGEFARTAIVHQPKAYSEAVTIDLARYVVPGIRGSTTSKSTQFFRDAVGPQYMEFDSLVTTDAFFAPWAKAIDRRYSGISNPRHGRQALGIYQRIVRIHGFLLPLLAAAAIVGLVKLRGPLRISIGVFGLVSAGLFVAPVMTFSYGHRYGVPPATLLAIAALIAIAGLVSERRDRPESSG